MPTSTSENSDVLSSLFFLKVGNESFDVSIPQREAEETVSLGALPKDIASLQRYLGQDARVLNGAGQELLRFHLEHVSGELNVVSGRRLSDVAGLHP